MGGQIDPPPAGIGLKGTVMNQTCCVTTKCSLEIESVDFVLKELIHNWVTNSDFLISIS